jgi:hypothetical protein
MNMKRRTISLVIGAVIVCAVGIGAFRAKGVVARPSAAGGYIQPTPLAYASSPQYHACVQRREKYCGPNPYPYQTFVAESPWAQTPGPNPQYITEDQAKARARNGLPVAERTTAPAYAEFMSYAQLQAIAPYLAENGQVVTQREFWVVTVHADVRTNGGPMLAARTVHDFTVVLDAESGDMTDWCAGCAVVKPN